MRRRLNSNTGTNCTAALHGIMSYDMQVQLRRLWLTSTSSSNSYSHSRSAASFPGDCCAVTDSYITRYSYNLILSVLPRLLFASSHRAPVLQLLERNSTVGGSTLPWSMPPRYARTSCGLRNSNLLRSGYRRGCLWDMLYQR